MKPQQSVLSHPRPLRVAIQTLGCRLNQYESDGIIQRFIESGMYEFCPLDEGPDIAIINTCTVTGQADLRSQNTLQAILKKNPDCQVIMTGCYAQTDPEKLKLPGVAFIIGNERKSSLFEIINGLKVEHEKKDSFFQERPRASRPGYGPRPRLDKPFGYGKVLPFRRTRAYLKIQDGCDKKCTYCKIPMARGRGVSRPFYEILEHVDYLQEEGIAEIVLTGVNLGWYRDPSVKVNFIALLEKILDRLKNSRLRLSSIEPCDVDAPLAQLSLDPRFCNFLHVPLQSASAKILKAMRRSYSPYSFRKRIDTLRSYNPDIFLGTDIMIGFPGETEADFRETLNFCLDLEIAGIHAFRFSPRIGAPASHFEGQVSLPRIKQRMKRLQRLIPHLWWNYAQKQKGKLSEGIVEKINCSYKGEDHYAEALTDHYLRVTFPTSSCENLRKGQKIKLRLEDRNEEETCKLMASLDAPK